MASSHQEMDRLGEALKERYQIERVLGQGGMATVYLAHDVKHDRQVALKVLNPELAAVVGADRFLSEIRTTAHLQHPNILPLFDSGEVAGRLFYVMPFVEGESLRDRLNREKQLPVKEAVRIATEVAEALQAAHEDGVIHRDIKPANILLRKGKPLVADFGIALAVSAAGEGRLTETGLSLGTPYYMSPEQASADRDPDLRSDIYSLGCVLYEMLTGEPPFPGPTAQSVLAKILTEQPPHPSEHRPVIPTNVEGAILKAIEKLPADRFGSMGKLKKALNDPAFRYGESYPVEVGVPSWWRSLALAAAAIAVVSIGLWAGGLGQGGEPVGNPLRVQIALPDTVPVSFAPGGLGIVRPALALSPEGERLAYVGEGPGGPLLYIRELGSDTPRPLSGTDGALAPFFSPDGAWIGFFTETQLKKVSSAGEELVTLADVNLPYGGTWHGERIVFSQGQTQELWEVSATSGNEPVSMETTGFWPHFLPDGDALLVSSRSNVSVLDPETGEYRPVAEGTMGRYLVGGQVLVTRPDGLWAVPFDLDQLAPTGPPRLVAPGVRRESGARAAQFASSPTGVIAYVSGPDIALGGLVWVDRDNRIVPLPIEPKEFTNPTLSPDGFRVAAEIEDQIWVFDLERGSESRLTRDGNNDAPVWHPDGETITFRRRGERFPDGVYLLRVDGVGEPELILQAEAGKVISPRSWSLDGQRLGVDVIAGGIWNVGVHYPMENADIFMMTDSPISAFWSAISPDGRWIAYGSPESGEDQMYVQPVPPTGQEWQVSAEGGAEEPRWSSDSKELIYRSGNRWLSVALREGAARPWAPPRQVLEGPYINVPGWSWDMTSDGSRFMVVQGPEALSSASTINLILNWSPEG